MAIKDLKKCVKSNNGKLYCWDSDLHSFVEIKEEVVSIEDLPKDVLIAVIEDSK